MALNTVSSDRLSTNVKNTNFTAAEKQDLTDDILPLAGQIGNRNLIINGSQIIDQRNLGSNVTAHLAYPTDRFRIIKDTSSGSFTAARSTDAPSGFKNSLLFTTGTAYTPSSGENNFIKYVIEGNDSAQLYFGNSAAKTITLSFYVKSSLTGNFAASILNGASNRSFPFSYSISSANTWTRITKTITGDTSGTWATDHTSGMQVTWALGVGSDFEGTADSWQGSAEYAVSGHVKVTSTASATFAITGVQLEVGSVATDFEHRSFADELRRCQRYYAKYQAGTPYTIFLVTVGYTSNDTDSRCKFDFVTEMRTHLPSFSYSNGSHFQDMSGKQLNIFQLADNGGSTKFTSMRTIFSQSFADPQKAYIIRAANNTNAYFEFDTEL